MKVWITSVVGICLWAAPLSAQQELPDPSKTPGAANPDVHSGNIQRTICRLGWTGTIRPPVGYLNDLKRSQIKQYGYSDTRITDYEEDYLIPLGLGGNQRDPKNLWPQSYNFDPWNAHAKDKLEDFLHSEVCAGRIPLQQAQQEIAADWIAAYKKYLGMP
jgi:hypothetical protein